MWTLYWHHLCCWMNCSLDLIPAIKPETHFKNPGEGKQKSKEANWFLGLKTTKWVTLLFINHEVRGLNPSSSVILWEPGAVRSGSGQRRLCHRSVSEHVNGWTRSSVQVKKCYIIGSYIICHFLEINAFCSAEPSLSNLPLSASGINVLLHQTNWASFSVRKNIKMKQIFALIKKVEHCVLYKTSPFSVCQLNFDKLH